MVEQIAREAGLKTGLYTSPHLQRFTERIRVAGREIDPEAVMARYGEATRALGRLRARDPAYATTFFELTTAMAFAHFRAEAVDLAVLEVGMEGALDATNICEPFVSAIVTIGEDHVDFLGRDLREVARRKGGIIKARTPFVCGVQDPELAGILRRICEERGAPMLRLGTDFVLRRATSGLRFEGPVLGIDLDRIALVGAHQEHNAAVALAIVDRLIAAGHTITPDAIRGGLGAVRWPGRLELFEGPPRVVLDGAHNAGGAAALAQALAKGFQYRRLLWVFGVLGDKDVRGICEPLGRLADAVYVCAPAYHRALDPAAAEAEVASHAPVAGRFSSVALALEAAMGDAGPDDLVVVAGSLFVVGEARDHLAGSLG